MYSNFRFVRVIGCKKSPTRKNLDRNSTRGWACTFFRASDSVGENVPLIIFGGICRDVRDAAYRSLFHVERTLLGIDSSNRRD